MFYLNKRKEIHLLEYKDGKVKPVLDEPMPPINKKVYWYAWNDKQCESLIYIKAKIDETGKVQTNRYFNVTNIMGWSYKLSKESWLDKIRTRYFEMAFGALNRR